MKTRLFLFAIIASSMTSCAYTGDPSEGGLLGWSSSQFNQRIDEKRQVLGGINRDTANQRAEAARLERQINASR